MAWIFQVLNWMLSFKTDRGIKVPSLESSLHSFILWGETFFFFFEENAKAVPHQDKLRGWVSHIWGNCRGQHIQSAMHKPHPGKPPSWSWHLPCQVSTYTFSKRSSLNAWWWVGECSNRVEAKWRCQPHVSVKVLSILSAYESFMQCYLCTLLLN